MSVTKYFLKTEWTEWTEVPMEVWVRAERCAGFYAKYGRPDDRPATGGFSSGSVEGRVEYGAEE